jgi:hypothetical protein
VYVHGGLFQPLLVRGECRFTLEMSVIGMFNIKVFRHSTLLYRVLHDERETYLAAVHKLMNCYGYVFRMKYALIVNADTASSSTKYFDAVK